MSHAKKSSNTLPWILLLALICIGGLFGMLLAEGVWDWLFLCCSTLPLAVGGWRWITGSSPKKRPLTRSQ